MLSVPTPWVFFYYFDVITESGCEGRSAMLIAKMKLVVFALVCFIKFERFNVTRSFMSPRMRAVSGTQEFLLSLPTKTWEAIDNVRFLRLLEGCDIDALKALVARACARGFHCKDTRCIRLFSCKFSIGTVGVVLQYYAPVDSRELSDDWRSVFVAKTRVFYIAVYSADGMS